MPPLAELLPMRIPGGVDCGAVVAACKVFGDRVLAAVHHHDGLKCVGIAARLIDKSPGLAGRKYFHLPAVIIRHRIMQNDAPVLFATHQIEKILSVQPLHDVLHVAARKAT